MSFLVRETNQFLALAPPPKVDNIIDGHTPPAFYLLLDYKSEAIYGAICHATRVYCVNYFDNALAS